MADKSTGNDGEMPAPIVQATEGSFERFGDLTDPTNPRRAAVGWVLAARDGDDALFRAFSVPDRSYTRQEVVSAIDGMGLSDRVINSEDPNRMVAMRLVGGMPEGQAVEIVGEMEAMVMLIVLVNLPLAGWSVWGLANEMPPITDVFTES
ncbi:hypothetical protein INN71_02825 [Nocardioides sp. ChNu-153]|uniref:hypothetical protein n=1 Tax=Nocardioides sp. ChNu-153 TaxID=2779364 RepID=UPI0026535E54|nr:hypothetical protein [Nocardioides sp. ChNu-153]MDN7120320.1 hypothetical protein [Nocardioides sp. ChNu-153]